MKAQSKFRFAKCSSTKNDYSDLRVSNAPAYGSGIAAGVSHAAVLYGDGSNRGSVRILPLEFSAYTRDLNAPLISAHGGETTDLAFSPYALDCLATAGAEGTVKLWRVPNDTGLPASTSEATASISGFQGGIHRIKWHPSAVNLLAGAGKSTLGVADMESGKLVHSYQVQGYGRDFVSLDWSDDGQTLAAVGKKGNLFLFDPRTDGAAAVVSGGGVDMGVNPSNIFSIDRQGNFAVVGVDKFRQAKMLVYDARNASEPVFKTSPQVSTGHLLTQYDQDTKLLFMTVRGSSMLQVFDVAAPTQLNQVTSYANKSALNAMSLVPKGSLNIVQNEVVKLLTTTVKSVNPISVTVPRKAPGFQSDLFPDSVGLEAKLTAADWLNGENAVPSLVNVEQLADSIARLATKPMVCNDKKPEEEKQPKKLAVSDMPVVDPTPPKSTASTTSSNSSHIAVKSDVRKRIDSVLKKSIFQHASAQEPNSKSKFYYDVQPDKMNSIPKNLAVNGSFLAFPWKSVGGSGVAVIPHGKFGRVGVNQPLFRGHRGQVTTLSLSVLQPNLLATGGPGGHVLVQTIPDGGLTQEEKEFDARLQCSGKITTLDFHPWVKDVLVSSSIGFDGASVRFWDLSTKEDRIHLSSLHPEAVNDMAFSPDGKLIATSSKDGLVRIIDPRAGDVVDQFSPPENHRDTRVLFTTDEDHLLTVGFGAQSTRSVSLWDRNALEKPVCTLEIDHDNSVMIPHYDPDTGLLYLASNGSRTIQIYQIAEKDDSKVLDIEWLSNYTSGQDIFGLAFFGKDTLDVKACEIARGVVLGYEKVVPISYMVPRKRKQFFQDDLFPPTRVVESLTASAADWFDGDDGEPRFVSLAPDGMEPVTEAPEEELTVNQKKYIKTKEALAKEPEKGMLGTADEVVDHFVKVAQMGYGGVNRWDAKVDSTDEIDDDEWD